MSTPRRSSGSSCRFVLAGSSSSSPPPDSSVRVANSEKPLTGS
ncbi:hypothetical protein AB0K81_14140 [Streptomyces werraensis]|uniref:Uncharacterized protein n=1 Tax=Streptomyces werraensis TaxID=68284 RepID=A0ABV3JJ63_9ACTN